MKTPLIYLSIITYMSILFFNKLNAQYLNARDLIITKEGDSIRAKVTKRDENSIYFTFIYNGEVRDTQLPVSSIKSYQKDFYIDNEVLKPKGSLSQYEDYKTFRLSFNTGFSYMTAKVEGPDAATLRKLKSGYHFGLDLTHFYSETFGVGLKYALFRSSTNAQGIYASFSHPFIGPSYSIRFFDSNPENSYIFSLALGYMGYRYKNGPNTVTGATLGTAFDLGYDLELGKKMSLGFQLSAIGGLLYKGKRNGVKFELDKDNPENMYRLDFSIGLRYNN